jgi:preprotein translocase subunit SecG
MSIYYIILSVVVMVLCVTTVTMILLQKKRDAGLGSTMTGQREAYWDANKGRSLEGALEKYTKVFFALILLLVLVLNIIR